MTPVGAGPVAGRKCHPVVHARTSPDVHDPMCGGVVPGCGGWEVACDAPSDDPLAGPETGSIMLAAELLDDARAHIGRVKAPRRINFRETLLRQETGKLYKRLLSDADRPERAA